MPSKQGEQLAEMPGNEDKKFWLEAENERIKIKDPVTCEKGKHEFFRSQSMEAMCRKCPIGFVLSVGNEVKDGHIYLHGTLLI